MIGLQPPAFVPGAARVVPGVRALAFDFAACLCVLTRANMAGMQTAVRKAGVRKGNTPLHHAAQ
eukprot:584008-Rhodomonas_salina.2